MVTPAIAMPLWQHYHLAWKISIKILHLIDQIGKKVEEVFLNMTAILRMSVQLTPTVNGELKIIITIIDNNNNQEFLVKHGSQIPLSFSD